MAEVDIYQLLLHGLSEDFHARSTAEQHLKSLEQANFPAFVTAVATALANAQFKPPGRRLAGLILKNVLDAKDEETKRAITQRWLSLDAGFRENVKNLILQTFSSDTEARHQAAQVCAKIAVIEIPQGQWPSLIEGLLSTVSTPGSSPFLIQSTLECLGYICEEIDMESIRTQTNLILTAVVRGMKNEAGNQEITFAATTALLNALEFVSENFKKQDERTYIMQVVCETTQEQNSPPVRHAAFECLVKIAQFYYDYLPPYMQGIFNITLNAISKEPEPIALQAVEFWSTICDEELEILAEIEDAASENRHPERTCHYFIKGALNYLVDVLTGALTKQNEDEEGEWNIAMAAGTCLGLIANTVLDAVVLPTLPFISTNIQNPNWRFREAAVFAFGAILEGPKSETLEQVIQPFPMLLNHLKDPHPLVKDTSAWTIGRICQLHPRYIYAYLPHLINSLSEALNDEPKIAANACWALHNIGSAYERDEDTPTSELSPHFKNLLTVLLKATEREDATESNLGCAAFEAINVLIMNATRDCYPLINELVPVLLHRLERTFTVQIVHQEDRENVNEQQALLCGTLQIVTQKLEKLISVFADKMMELFLQVFSASSKNATVNEETLMAVGALASAVEADFVKYLPSFMPFVYVGLQNWEAHTVCSVAVGVVGDLCRAVGKNIMPYCDEIVTLLLRDLQNPRLNRSVKPGILSCFGDIALAIGAFFEKYLAVVMAMLQQAKQTQVRDPDDYDEVEFVNSLREGIFETFTGTIQGLRMDRKAPLFEPYVELLVSFIEEIWDDPNRNEGATRGAIGVLGDLVQTLEDRVTVVFAREGIKKVMAECRESPNTQVKEIALWTQGLVQSFK